MRNQTAKPANAGIARLVKATGYSMQGFKAAFKHEAAIRQEVALMGFAFVIVWFFDLSAAERAVLLASVVLVFIVELINSAIEAVVDRIGTEQHELSGRAKDIGSAAVLTSLLFAAFTWGYILLTA